MNGYPKARECVGLIAAAIFAPVILVSCAAQPPVPPSVPNMGPLTADVFINCDVDIDGAVSDCVVISNNGTPQFSVDAIKFAQGHRCQPATSAGRPIETRKTWKFHFALDAAAPKPEK